MIIVYGLVLLIALLVLAALIVKKEYKIERVIIINQPVERVFDYLRYLEHQNNYNKWWMVDRNAKRGMLGQDGSVGCIVSWDSENKQLGKGEQEIKGMVINSQIDHEIRFVKPFKSVAQIVLHTEVVTDDITRFRWVFMGKNQFPMSIMNLMMDKLLGKDLEESAAKLKEILEHEISN